MEPDARGANRAKSATAPGDHPGAVVAGQSIGGCCIGSAGGKFERVPPGLVDASLDQGALTIPLSLIAPIPWVCVSFRFCLKAALGRASTSRLRKVPAHAFRKLLHGRVSTQFRTKSLQLGDMPPNARHHVVKHGKEQGCVAGDIEEQAPRSQSCWPSEQVCQAREHGSAEEAHQQQFESLAHVRLRTPTRSPAFA